MRLPDKPYTAVQPIPGRYGKLGSLPQTDGQMAISGGRPKAQVAAVQSVAGAPVLSNLRRSVSLDLLLLQEQDGMLEAGGRLPVYIAPETFNRALQSVNSPLSPVVVTD